MKNKKQYNWKTEPRKALGYPKREDFTKINKINKLKNSKAYIFFFGKKLTKKEKMIERIKQVTHYNTGFKYVIKTDVDAIFVKIIKKINTYIRDYKYLKKITNRKKLLKMSNDINSYINNHSLKYRKSRMKKYGMFKSMLNKEDNTYWIRRDDVDNGELEYKEFN